MRDALKSIQPRTVREPFEEEEEFKELEMASAQLEKSMIQMARVGNSFWGKLGQELYKGDEPNGLSSVRTTHEAIFGHSKGTTHAVGVDLQKLDGRQKWQARVHDVERGYSELELRSVGKEGVLVATSIRAPKILRERSKDEPRGRAATKLPLEEKGRDRVGWR
jgi:hypothetical protein